MDDPVTAHHNWGYFCLAMGIVALIATPWVFIFLVNDFFGREEERLRLDYALTPKFLREPWFFALKGRVWRTLLAVRAVAFAVLWLIFGAVMIMGGLTMIRQP